MNTSELRTKLDAHTPIGGEYMHMQSPLTFEEVTWLIHKVERNEMSRQWMRSFLKGNE